MGKYDTFRNRVGAVGNSFEGATVNATVSFINQSFTDSPFYFNLPIDNVNTDVQVIMTEDPHTKNLIFRPHTKINKGAMVTYNGDQWLVVEFEPNDIYAKAKMQQCNNKLRWNTKDGTLKSLDCVLVSLHRKIDMREDRYMLTNDFQVRVLVQYNDDSKLIKTSQRFIFGNQAYQVYGIDDATSIYDGKGYIELAVEITTVMATDDMVNGIADNAQLYHTPTQTSAPDGSGKIKW